MSKAGTVAPLVLAAGASRRFGSDKLLAPLEGRPLLTHVLEALAEAVAGGLLVGGVGVAPADDGPVARMLREAGLEVVTAPGATRALGESLRAGIHALGRAGSGAAPAAALVVLGDQPRLRPTTVGALVAAWREGAGPVVRPAYAGDPPRPGHPVLLDRSVWHLATKARGDAGLRDVFAAAGTRVHELPIAGASPDVDTPADLAALGRKGEEGATS